MTITTSHPKEIILIKAPHIPNEFLALANAGDVAPDNEKINSQRLVIALLKLENFLGGRAVIDTILISLKDSGINLDDETKYYSLDELEEGLRKIIGEASVFVIARLKEVH